MTIGSRDRAWVEINMQNLCHNAKVIQEALPDGCEIMAVVKANAYGHGAAGVSSCLNEIGIHSFAVATIEEGIELRKCGIQGDILILGYTPAERADGLYRYHLTQTVVDIGHAQELNRYGKPIKIHIKVDTGMNRLGEDYRHADEIASIFGCKHLKVTGIFSHMSVSDGADAENVSFSYSQLQHFHSLMKDLEERRIALPKIHIQSSYGVMNYPELKCSYARIGIALYGVLSTSDGKIKRPLDLRPVLALKARVILVKTVDAGESVGYGRDYITGRETRIAVISIGYADGFPRSLSSGQIGILIHGLRAPIIGRICMDQLMADVTGIPEIMRGDTATLIGKEGANEITAEQVAVNAGTITNELLSRLGSRLERFYLEISPPQEE